MKIKNYLTIILLLLGSAYFSNAQVSTIPFTSALDTFGIINGTVLDAPNVDDVVYKNLPIGFTLDLGGNLYDKMSVNTNGYIELDTNGTPMFVNILGGTRNNLVAPFAADLIHHLPNASLQYTTIGTAPNRITIVQWLHYSYFGNSGDVSFQIWMYETTNCIKFIYGANNYAAAPFQTQIGIRGDTISDFIVLGDTTCNWANAYPFPTITTYFPINISCSMPAGFSYNFGYCGYNGPYPFAYLTGKVFNDINGNGTYDPLEPPIPYHVVNSTLTYNLSTGPITYWNQTNVPAVISVNPLTQPCSGLNFGFQVIPNIHEVSITCPNWGAKPGQPEPMPIHYSNNGTSIESDTITFVMDSLYSFISSIPAPDVINGQTLQWAYSNLQPGQNGSIMLYLLPSINAVLGNYLDSKLTIAPTNDTVPTNNEVNLHQLISNSWDPNEKDATPSGMIAAGTEINYTIHFQNTGNAAADNVIIRDTLDQNLDLLSFRFTGSTHPVNFSMSGNGIATFTFFNIQLPDSGTDMEGSNGAVSFAVKTKAALSPLTVINNTAGIYFDFNPAVITNTVADTIQMPLAVINISNTNDNISVAPNPAGNYVVFSFSADVNEKAELNITTTDGKLLLTKNNVSSIEKVDISRLASGIYICTIKSDKGLQSIKIVKE